MALLLPDELREKFKKPLGKLYSGSDCMEKLKASLKGDEKIIAIGDMATYSAIKAGIVPDVAVVDEKTLRTKVSDEVIKCTRQPYFREIKVVNPPAKLTNRLLEALEEALESMDPTRIFVDGEEDLATIPAIALAPISSIVIYGQPDEGVVAVRVTQSKKKLAKKVLDKMEG